MEPVNLNGATEYRLGLLTGVGPHTVARIVAARPFGAIDELLTRGIVSQRIYRKIAEQLTVGEPQDPCSSEQVQREPLGHDFARWRMSVPGPLSTGGPVR